jgi:hypothetical protein
MTADAAPFVCSSISLLVFTLCDTERILGGMNKRDDKHDDAKRMLINPYYAISISPDLLGEHEPLITREQYKKINAKLVAEMGFEPWLDLHLDVLAGDLPRQPES